jgi:putative heme-binding domain-containing protein
LSITDKSLASLLAAVLDPSAAVESRYISYGVLTDDGRIHNGLLSTETASSMTLLNSESKSVTILRSEIEEIRASGKSLMPEGLEKEVTQQDMADLLQFLRGSLTSDHAKP